MVLQGLREQSRPAFLLPYARSMSVSYSWHIQSLALRGLRLFCMNPLLSTCQPIYHQLVQREEAYR